MTWVWAIILLVVGLCLGFLELFFPSAGLLAVLSGLALVAGVVVAFYESALLGTSFLIITAVGVPTMIVLGLKWWPKTAIGRRVMLSVPTEEDVLPDDPAKSWMQSLPGKIGKTKTKMMPGGIVVVDGRNVEAVSEGAAIEAGQMVIVLQIRGKRAVIRPASPDEVPTKADPLDRPIDGIADDPFK